MPNTRKGEPRFQARYFVGYSQVGKRIYRSRTFSSASEAQEWYAHHRRDRAPSPNADLIWPEKWNRSSYTAARSNALSRGIAFDLTFKDYVDLINAARGRCVLTGIQFEFQFTSSKSRRRPFAPSLDRVDSNKGYSKDNCRLICAALNCALGDWGMDPLMRIARALVVRETFIVGRYPVARVA
jgi:hypothetical protein